MINKIVIKGFHRHEHNCGIKEFQCPGNKCLPMLQICDGKDDCPQSQDEQYCGTRQCSASNILKCAGNRRYPRQLDDITVETCGAMHMLAICMYEIYESCKNNAFGHYIFRLSEKLDTLNMACDKILKVDCSVDQWKCNSGECIPKQYKCDGKDNCQDFSDERNCIPGQCHKSDIRCKNTQCVRENEFCDGIADCTDLSDESWCSDRTYCQGFRCPNGTCISILFQCDGLKHCIDGSDEESCVICNALSWRCSNNSCIHVTHICDGVSNCPDGSDELNCTYCVDDQYFTFQNKSCNELTRNDCTERNVSEACCYTCNQTIFHLEVSNDNTVKIIVGVAASSILVITICMAVYVLYIKGHLFGRNTSTEYDAVAVSQEDSDPIYEDIDHYDLLTHVFENDEENQ